ncbi:MAG: primosomal protein N' [Defluviitaleaceae bacterium]|nr:primosomal protein N' [Defluviitaleaceae bacterium]
MTPASGKYARVCVDSASEKIDRLFTYAIPECLCDSIGPGRRVKVPFGLGEKLRNAVVFALDDEPGFALELIKEIAGLVDDYPVLNKETLELAAWMGEKYFTPLALCVRTMLPAGLGKGGKKRSRKASPAAEIKPAGQPELTDEQSRAIKKIESISKRKDPPPVLLHGVTGSGKTEVYIRFISGVVESGKQAIVLVPEIALTPQTVDFFSARFGDKVAVTHSRLSEGERFAIWKKAKDGEIGIVIGPRSAVFAPFEKLGAIIIDEEHEHTYHSEISPKYDAREVAKKRAELTGALVLLGSATPSLESYHLAGAGYELIKLKNRVNGMFPEVCVVDMRTELIEGNPSIFSRPFAGALGATLERGKQAMIFLNRRGHSTYVSCRICGDALKCDRCDVCYTWHAAGDRLVCHYCQKSVACPKICPACGSEYLKYFGIGTQRVEEEVNRLWPEVKCLRMDFDTTRVKDGHGKILAAFGRGEAQVLIGTQMIAKGLDFPEVVLVGVVAADVSLYSGDFRSGEHTFQLLAQVSGRAGRAAQPGRVYIQTYNPEHYAINYAQSGDYEAFYENEITIRKTLNYPPFTHVFSILFTGPDERAVIGSLHTLAAIMRYCNKKGMFETLGPSPANVSKIKEQYRWKLLVKGEDENLLKKFALYCVNKLRENEAVSGITARLALDPANME